MGAAEPAPPADEGHSGWPVLASNAASLPVPPSPTYTTPLATVGVESGLGSTPRDLLQATLSVQSALTFNPTTPPTVDPHPAPTSETKSIWSAGSQAGTPPTP